jgi:hypothetical protein
MGVFLPSFTWGIVSLKPKEDLESKMSLPCLLALNEDFFFNFFYRAKGTYQPHIRVTANGTHPPFSFSHLPSLQGPKGDREIEMEKQEMERCGEGGANRGREERRGEQLLQGLLRILISG